MPVEYCPEDSEKHNHKKMFLKFNITAAFFVLAVCACAQQKINLPAKYKTLDMEAHRGGKGLMPENTIPAMLHAIDMGVTTLEMDARITKDWQVVVSHDATINADFILTPEGDSMTKADGKSRVLFEMAYDSIKKYDVGSKWYKNFPLQRKMKVSKPLLKDLLKATEAYAKKKGVRIQYNIEIKSRPDTGIAAPPVDSFVHAVMNVINPFHLGGRLIIQSFHDPALQLVHRLYPKIRTSFLVEGYDKRTVPQQLKALGFVPEIYSPNHEIVTKKLVETCHQYKMKIVPWTIDDRETMNTLLTMGVDGIITDYPDLFYQLK